MTAPAAPQIRFDAPDDGRAVSRHELRRFLAGELDEARRAAVAQQLVADESLKAEHDELLAEVAAFRATMPFERFAARHEARAQASTFDLMQLFARFRLQIGGAAVAGAAAAMLVFVLPSVEDGTGVGDDTAMVQGSKIQLKGSGAKLGLFIREDGAARLGDDGEQLRPGDQIQFVIRDDSERPVMVLLGIDGAGVVTVYEATSLRETTEKGAGIRGQHKSARVLEQSLILDDALGPERFFAIYGEGNTKQLLDAARQAARELARQDVDLRNVERLPLERDDVRQSSIHIVKVQR